MKCVAVMALRLETVESDRSPLPCCCQVLVKVDKQYPYGEWEDAYKGFLDDVVDTPLIVGEVGVQDYANMDNDDIRERALALGVILTGSPLLILALSLISAIVSSGGVQANKTARR